MFPDVPPGPFWRRGGPVLTPGLRLKLFHIFVHGIIGVHLPFWPVWLKGQGLEASAIGFVLAAGTWSRLVASPLVGHLADVSGERKRLIVVLAFASTFAFALFGLAEGFWVLFALALLHGALWSPILPLAENITLLTAFEYKLQYGRIRLWGSIAFMVVSTAAGLVLKDRPVDLILWLIVAALGASALASLALPDVRPVPTAESSEPRGRAAGLLRQPLFIAFLLGAGVIQASHAVLYAFATLHWRAAGHGDDIIGLLWAEGVIAEIILFAFGAALVRRTGAVALLLMGAAAGMLRWTLTGLSTDLGALAVLQVLHAFTFGAAHLGAMQFIAQFVQPRRSASAQGLYSVAAGGALGIGLMTAGPLYAALAGQAFLVMTLLSLAGGAAMTLVAILWRGRIIG